MEHDEFQNYLDVLKEQRKTEREREIEREMKEIGIKHQRALQEALAPLIKELAEIEMKKPPLPVMVEGKIYEYVGPR